MFLRRAHALALIFVLPGIAFGWWNESWSERKTLLVDTTAAGANLNAPINEATVLLRLHQGNFPGFLTVREGGADFRLIAGDDQTPLSYHVERFDPVTQMALVWVKKPVINPQSGEEKFYLYYGNPEAVGGGDAPATFDVNTVAAFHFDETDGMPVDSSAYKTAIESGEVFANPSSIIGGGATLPGTEPLLIADGGPLALAPEQGWSFSAWMKVPESPESPVYLMDRRSESARVSLVLSGTTLAARYGDSEVTSPSPVNPGQWHHVGLVLAGGEMHLYVDGMRAGMSPVSLAPMSGPVAIGGSVGGTGVTPLDLDELRISVTGRSAAWMQFAASIQGERNDAVVTYGAAESGEGGGHAEGGHGAGHFATIWNNVFGPGGPLVERIVIMICGLMMVVAIAVIFFKTLLLSRARRATNAFEKAFARLKVGATNPDEQFGALAGREKRFGDSPLFQVYKTAVEQVEARQASPSVGAHAAGLDSKTIKTIQAGMDSKMVRQSQKLNAWMVLLTIAISGGPFIGLLGTVVGVMTTFGAIAATGDINITAIAPGMAAALLATVAGLGVAIPALFGYNYLGSKIKELTADMSVFADELTARITEEFGA